MQSSHTPQFAKCECQGNAVGANVSKNLAASDQERRVLLAANIKHMSWDFVCGKYTVALVVSHVSFLFHNRCVWHWLPSVWLQRTVWWRILKLWRLWVAHPPSAQIKLEHWPKTVWQLVSPDMLQYYSIASDHLEPHLNVVLYTWNVLQTKFSNALKGSIVWRVEMTSSHWTFF